MARGRKRKPSNAKKAEGNNESGGQNEENDPETKDAIKEKSITVKTEDAQKVKRAQKGKRVKPINNGNETKEEEEEVPTPAMFIESFCSLDKEGRIEALKKLIASFDADEIDKALEIMDAKLADKVDEEENDATVKSEQVNVKEESLVYVAPVMETDEDVEMDFEIKRENAA